MTPTALELGIGAGVALARRHRRACEATRAYVAGIKPDQWRHPTNSEGDVRGLVSHLAAGQHLAAELLRGRSEAEAGPQFSGDLLGHDPLAAYDAACADAQAEIDAPDVLSRICRLEHGDMPAAVWVSIRLMDVFIHGWDLASATGQDTTLDPELVDAVYAEWAPRAEMLRAGGKFAPALDVPAGASAQARLLALLGRRDVTLIRVKELGHAGMFVRDLNASVRFYRDLLGLSEVGRIDGASFLSSGRTHVELALIQPGPEALPAPRPAFGLFHLALKVGDSLEELRQARGRLVAAGMAVERPEDFNLFQSVHVQDPDGTDVELYVDTNQAWRQDPRILENSMRPPQPLYL
jgi:uncharacterized protein (TIGR03086 family)